LGRVYYDFFGSPVSSHKIFSRLIFFYFDLFYFVLISEKVCVNKEF